MQVDLDVALDNSAKRADEFVNLTRVSTANGVGDTDAVNTDLVYGLVDGKEVDKIGPEGVLCRKADLDTWKSRNFNKHKTSS